MLVPALPQASGFDCCSSPARVVKGFQSSTLHGPHGSFPSDTEFYQKETRERGNGRKPLDLILKLDSGLGCGPNGPGWTDPVFG